MQKIVTSGTLITTTDYLNGFQYKNTVLQFFPTAEGYVNFDSDVYKYVYNYLDHLGNVRLSYTADPNQANGLAVMEQNHYYPFGLKHTKYNVGILKLRGRHTEPTLTPEYKYKYNGKEYQDELGLNMYDYGWRNYDPAIGRWMNIDNMAGKYNSFSPYHYAGNNPVSNIDVDGNEFTEGAWKWVNNLISNINSRQESNNKSIASYKEKIANGGTERQLARWNKSINSLSSNNEGLEQTRGEIATLAASNQTYDVIQDNGGTRKDAIGNSETSNSTGFNFSNGNVEITVSSGTSMGLFAHELNHAYQFETGKYSIGPKLSSSDFSNLLYDKHDEIEAYNRGAIFGENTYNLKSLPSEYSSIATGPTDYRNLRQGMPNQEQYLQNLAKSTGHAFRVNGKTYYKKR